MLTIWIVESSVRRNTSKHPLDDGASPATLLRVLDQVDSVFVAVDKVGMLLVLPLVLDLRDRDHPDLVALPDDAVVRVVVAVAGDEVVGSLLDVLVGDGGGERPDLGRLLLEGHLPRHVPDQVVGQVQLLHDVLRRVHLPCDGELDVAADLSLPVAGGAVDLALGAALGAVLLPVAVLGVLAVEAPLPVAGTIRDPAVPVAVQTSGPSLARAVPTGDTSCAAAAVARLDASRVGHGDQPHLVLKCLGWVLLYLPRQRRNAAVTAVQEARTDGGVSPGRLSLLRKRLELVVKGRSELHLLDLHVLGSGFPVAAVIGRQVREKRSPRLLLRQPGLHVEDDFDGFLVLGILLVLFARLLFVLIV